MKKIIFLFGCIISSHLNAMLISDFPTEVRIKILKNAPLSPWLETIEEVNGVISSLARINKSWNSFINDSENTLSLIKKLSKRFDLSNMEVTKKLSTKEARHRYIIQDGSSRGWKNHHDSSLVSHRLNEYLARGLDVNFTYDIFGETLLIKAIYKENPDRHAIVVGPWLIRNGADINMTMKGGKNAPMLAIDYFDEQLILLLLDHPKLDIHHQDDNGNTILHYCFKNGLFSSFSGQIVFQRCEKMCFVIEKLLEKGANPLLCNKKQETPIDLAKKTGYKSFLDILYSQYNS